jgi:hypothetical protein
MKDSLYRACMVQLQQLLASKERTPEQPALGPGAPNYALMMRVRR